MLRRVPTRHAKRVLAGRYRACRSPSLSYASVSPSRPNIVRSPFVLDNPAAKRVIEIPRPTPPAVAATRSDSRQLNASHPCSCLPVDIRLHTRLVTGRTRSASWHMPSAGCAAPSGPPAATCFRGCAGLGRDAGVSLDRTRSDANASFAFGVRHVANHASSFD